jgi:preprotein translocase subunit SecY
MASAAEQLAANLNVEAFSKATELHKRLIFTLVAMIVYRIGCYIPIPGINIQAFSQAFQGQSGGLLGMFNMLIAASGVGPRGKELGFRGCFCLCNGIF